MKKVIKITLLLFACVVILLVTSLFVFSKYYGDRISQIVITELNKKLNVKVSVGSIDFSVFKHFPSASISLNEVTIYSSETFNKKEFTDKSDVFLTSKHLSLQFNILDILKKKYDINKILLVDSKIRIYTDKKGRNNLSLLKTDTSKSEVQIDLRKVDAENCDYSYTDNRSTFTCNGFIESCHLKGHFASNDFELETKVKGISKQIYANHQHFPSNISIDLESSLHVKDSTYTITKCNLSLNDIETKVTGKIQKKKFYYINLDTKVEFAKWSDITIYLPESIQKKLKPWKLDGELQLSVYTKGSISNNELPSLKVAFAVENGTFSYKGKANDLKCKGIFQTQNLNNTASYSLLLDTIYCSHNNSSYSGHVSLTDFDNGHIKTVGDIRLQLSDIADFIENKQTEFSGSVYGKLSFETDLNNLDTLDEHIFEKINLISNIEINNGAFSYKPNHYVKISNITAKLKTNNDDYQIDTCRFDYFGSQMSVKGTIANFLKFVLNNNQTLSGELTLKSNCIDYNRILKSTNADSSTIILPLLYNVKVNFETECLNFQKVNLQNVRGQFIYNSEGIKAEKLSFFLFDGRLNGDVYISQLKNKGFILKSKLTTTNVHVDKIFSAMNNFNQKILIDKNIKGLITSDITLTAELKNDFSLIPKSLLMECSATINNGRLLNFEPMKKLSKFVDVAELEDVSFSTLKNTFAIKDEKIIIPQMEIKSSALSLQMSGTHMFSNNFEYNVQVYLSDLLAKKHKTKHPDEYFGEVIDDGSVQTRLPLKIIGSPNDYKINYDTKTAKENVKESIKKEKSEIARIFKEEFGSSKKDSSSTKKTQLKKEEPKPKFEIEFE